jgi:gamma-glutamyl:cysteine ligase YbdK (ATP-grasp superfamily)
VGQEIGSQEFQPEDFERFQEHLRAELELLGLWFSENRFAEDELQIGLELEAWLIDRAGVPTPDNALFLATLDSESVVPELSRFNFEFNVSPQYLAGRGMWQMHGELLSTWERCGKTADTMDHRIVAIGILPTVEDSMLCLENLSPLRRYAALNEQVLKLRRGRPIQLAIEREDRLTSTHQDLMLEAAATSVQVHLKVPERLAVRYYNASLVASAFTVAVAANAPLLFGRRLWWDTRIPLFEQAVDTAGQYPRVSFGHRYMSNSLFEHFEHNCFNHRVLLPAELEEPPARMPYTRMHNGTLWNWNRPLIGFEADGRPHLRIEHRPMSASPTMADLLADMLLYVGITRYLAELAVPPEEQLTFEQTRSNFYAAARDGLDASIRWTDGKDYRLRELLAVLIDDACEALHGARVDEDAIEHACQVIHGRLKSGQTGSAWQLRKFAEYDGDVQRLLMAYIDAQAQGAPVHTWQ